MVHLDHDPGEAVQGAAGAVDPDTVPEVECAKWDEVVLKVSRWFPPPKPLVSPGRDGRLNLADVGQLPNIPSGREVPEGALDAGACQWCDDVVSGDLVNSDQVNHGDDDATGDYCFLRCKECIEATNAINN